MKVFSLLCVLALGSSASAQDITARLDSWSPRFSYGQVNINGEVISVSYNRVGRFTYGYYSDGSYSTTTKVGSRTYTDLWLSPRKR